MVGPGGEGEGEGEEEEEEGSAVSPAVWGPLPGKQSPRARRWSAPLTKAEEELGHGARFGRRKKENKREDVS